MVFCGGSERRATSRSSVTASQRFKHAAIRLSQSWVVAQPELAASGANKPSANIRRGRSNMRRTVTEAN
jgi:hypothetical protein